MSRERIELLQGTLDLIILRLLGGGAKNGWDVTQAIHVVTRGLLDVNYGSVYPALRRLEVRGLVRGKWGVSENNRRARIYELTPAGNKQLAAERTEWNRYTTAIGLILSSE
jgi:PadR family transcriptional regulator, regulatory protein PadR